MTCVLPGQLDLFGPLVEQHQARPYVEDPAAAVPWWRWLCSICSRTSPARWSHQDLAETMASHHNEPIWRAS